MAQIAKPVYEHTPETREMVERFFGMTDSDQDVVLWAVLRTGDPWGFAPLEGALKDAYNSGHTDGHGEGFDDGETEGYWRGRGDEKQAAKDAEGRK